MRAPESRHECVMNAWHCPGWIGTTCAFRPVSSFDSQSFCVILLKGIPLNFFAASATASFGDWWPMIVEMAASERVSLSAAHVPRQLITFRRKIGLTTAAQRAHDAQRRASAAKTDEA